MVDEVAGKEAVGEGEVIVVVDKATVVEIEILEEISAMGDVAMVDAVIIITVEEEEVVIEAAEGELIVVAAGALHLAGPYGLPNLLEQRGYTLERLPF